MGSQTQGKTYDNTSYATQAKQHNALRSAHPALHPTRPNPTECLQNVYTQCVVYGENTLCASQWSRNSADSQLALRGTVTATPMLTLWAGLGRFRQVVGGRPATQCPRAR
jgi:hypothetical protein